MPTELNSLTIGMLLFRYSASGTPLIEKNIRKKIKTEVAGKKNLNIFKFSMAEF